MKTVLALVALALIGACAHPTEVIAFQAPLELARSLPSSVGDTGYVYSWTETCPDSGAELIAPPAATAAGLTIGHAYEITCQNPSTTIVAFGDSTLTDPAIGTRDAPVYCTTNCPSAEWKRPVFAGYCRSDLTSIVVYCDAVVKATSPL